MAPLPRAATRNTGLPPGVAVGPLGRRLVAQLIDLAVPAAVVAIVFATGVDRTAVLGGAAVVLVWALIVWGMFATRAAGPGMRLMRLQLVGLADGRPIGWGRFLVRALVLAALTATALGLVLMIIFLIVHRRHQGWHDLVADSVVIKERMLAPPRGKAGTARAPAPPPSRPATPAVAGATVVGTEDTAAQDLAATPSAGHTDDATRVHPASAGPGTADAEADSEWVAVLSDGREIPVLDVVLVGRNPEPRPGEEDAELIRVADGSRTVSKSHLALGRDAAGAYVRDLGSTNGSTVTDFSGISRPCPPGEEVRVDEGTIVSFGDLWLEIRHRPAPIGSAHAPVGS